MLETMAFYACVIYLTMPLLGYSVYTSHSRVAVLWKKQMPVPYEIYFGFVLPAVTSYIIGLFLINSVYKTDEGQNIFSIINIIKKKSRLLRRPAFWLIAIGVSFYFARPFLPGALSAVGTFSYLLLFSGLLYLHFQPRFKRKFLVYVGACAFLLLDAINTGMFTVFLYMGITIISFFILGKRTNILFKLSMVVLAISAVMILQVVKSTLRKETWHSNYEGSKAELFQNLVLKKAENFSDIFSENAFFPIYARLNQGWNVCLVMRRIPAQQPYDDGVSIATTLAASVIPRVLWPNKPESGGAYNMKHFAGFILKGWSTNIGPVGEAYGNFGVSGGIIYMFFFGLFIGGAYCLVYRVSRTKNPLFILWIPLLFFEVTYSMENDTLQAVNSLVKGIVFMWLMYKLFPFLFAVNNKNSKAPKNENRDHLGDNRPGWSLSGELPAGQGI